MPETPIKPGDVVRTDIGACPWIVLAMNTKFAFGYVNPRSIDPRRERAAPRYHESYRCEWLSNLERLPSPPYVSMGEREATLLAIECGLPGRDYALARGWRELDREDVTEYAVDRRIYFGGECIGAIWTDHHLPEVAHLAERWHCSHRGTMLFATYGADHPFGKGLGPWDRFDDALAELIAAENARRAKEGK